MSTLLGVPIPAPAKGNAKGRGRGRGRGNNNVAPNYHQRVCPDDTHNPTSDRYEYCYNSYSTDR